MPRFRKSAGKRNVCVGRVFFALCNAQAGAGRRGSIYGRAGGLWHKWRDGSFDFGPFRASVNLCAFNKALQAQIFGLHFFRAVAILREIGKRLPLKLLGIIGRASAKGQQGVKHVALGISHNPAISARDFAGNQPFTKNAARNGFAKTGLLRLRIAGANGLDISEATLNAGE